MHPLALKKTTVAAPCVVFPCILFLILIGMAAPVPAWTEPAAASASHMVLLKVSEVAVLNLSDDRPLDLSVVSSSSTGFHVDIGDTGTKRLNYTAVNSRGRTRSIMVQWAPADAAPAGTSLWIRAAYVPAGCGRAVGEIAIDSMPRALIRDILTCATGTGSSGAELRYRFVVDDPSRATAGSQRAVMIIFTISDDA